MATQKIYDLAVKVGEYTDREGNTKGRYQNVGAVMQKDDGGKFIMLERWFNPAGVPNPDNRSSLLLSMFEPRDNSGGQQPRQQQQRQQQPQQRSAPPASQDMNDDIPF
ncbi:hypothetical protein y223_00012 [Bordetella phage PY223]